MPAPAPTRSAEAVEQAADAPALEAGLTPAERRGFLIAVETAELFAGQLHVAARHVAPDAPVAVRLRAAAYAELASLLRGAL
jgi:hypothetical protein